MAAELRLDAPGGEPLRLAFGYACVLRVQHLLEEADVVACLRGLGAYLDGTLDRAGLDWLAAEAARLANQHRGSRSIDGCGHAAVSASYAVANALAGKALQAADYAAYAVVYGQGGYGAVAEPQAFEPEFAWQVDCLTRLSSSTAAPLNRS
nr:hypothetical protein [Caldimonas mangrovi]